jgi:hypothetical protein
MEWVNFLTDHHIPWVSRGPNTKRGEISIQCPFCGSDDPSEHLGINLTIDVWGCHRNPAHRGKSPVYLIKHLLGCSQSQAQLTVRQYGAADPDTLETALASLLDEPITVAPRPEKLVMPHEFMTLGPKPSATRFRNYLQRRGFDDIDDLGRRYQLRYCSTGRWKDRIIFPVFRRGKLVAWTGRAISNPINAPRYLSTSNEIKKAILNEDDITLGGNILFITEGPIDAIKIDYYGRSRQAHATCVFGTSITLDQIALIKQASRRYRYTVLLLDPDAIETSFNVIEWLPNAIMGTIPSGVEDPGAMTKEQVEHLVHNTVAS